MLPCWMSCQPLGKCLNNKSWTVHPNIAFRREGHRKIQVRDLYLMQMMSQCRATSRKSRHRSLHVAIPNVAGDTSRATRRLSHLTEHKQRNKCVANNVVVAVACRVSRVTEHGLRLDLTSPQPQATNPVGINNQCCVKVVALPLPMIAVYLFPGHLKMVHAERTALKPKFWNEWMNEKDILGFKLHWSRNFFLDALPVSQHPPRG